MSFVKYRVKEVAADFGIAPKEVSEIIGKFMEKPKSYTQVLTDQELNLFFDYMTQKNQIKSLEQVFAAKPTAPKAEAPKSAAPQQPAQNRPQGGQQGQNRPQGGQQGQKLPPVHPYRQQVDSVRRLKGRQNPVPVKGEIHHRLAPGLSAALLYRIFHGVEL